MFLDLQFSESKFLEMLRDQVQRALPVIPDEINALGKTILIDHLDVEELSFEEAADTQISLTGPAGATSIAGTVAMVKIPLRAHLTSRANVLAAANMAAPAEVIAIQLWLIAAVSATAQQGSIALTVTPQSVGDILGLINDAQKQDLLAKVPPVSQVIALPDIAGTPVHVFNAGFAHIGNSFVLLAELSSPTNGSLASWSSFFAGNYPVRPGDWSILIPKDLLVTIVNDTITDSVNAIPAKDPSVEVIEQPHSSWSGTGITSVATINAIDACPVLASDIAAELDFTVQFSLSGDQIQVTIDVSWDLNDWDVFRCAAATVILPGSIVTVLAGVFFGPVGAIIGIIATIAGTIVAIVKISDVAHGQLSSGVAGIDPGSMHLQTVAQDDSHVTIQGRVGFSGMMPGMTLKLVQGTADGLVVGGELAVTAHAERSLKVVGQSSFAWDTYYSCSSKNWQEDQVDAKLDVYDPAQYPLKASFELVTQPATVYTAKLQQWGAPIGGVTLTAHSQITTGSAPDCDLILFTNSGIRHVVFKHLSAPPPKPSAEELMKAKIGCYKTTIPGPKQWLEALWLIDPPPYERLINQLHVWEVAVSHAMAGSKISLAIMDQRGKTRDVAVMTANTQGQALFRVATKPSEHVAIGAERGLDKASLFVGGAVLEQVARFVPYLPAKSAHVSGNEVFLTTGEKLMQFNLDGTLLNSLHLSDARLASLPSGSTSTTGKTVQSVTNEPVSGIQVSQTNRMLSNPRVLQQLLNQANSSARPVAQDKGRDNKWLAEEWLKQPIRTGNLIARVENGAVTIYRYARTAIM